jgi:peptidoglycan/xylan/chitin deacetylase (PgdA/CDA1 family)
MSKKILPKHHLLLIFIYIFYSFFEPILEKLRILKSNKLRVILYHDIPPHLVKNFQKQLLYISKKWNFITPDEFSEMINGERPIIGKNILLTFDDGFMSNKVVADNVLNILNIKAIFFIIPNFAIINDRSSVNSFILNNIFPGIDNIKLQDYQYNMNWDDIRYLSIMGHKIGAHTLSHARLSQINKEVDLKNEILSCAKILEDKLQIKIDHFAFPFGNLTSINKNAFEIIKENYKFLHTGLRGNNPVDNFIVLRDAINPGDPNLLVASYLSGISDFHYKSSIHKIHKW